MRAFEYLERPDRGTLSTIAFTGVQRQADEVRTAWSLRPAFGRSAWPANATFDDARGFATVLRRDAHAHGDLVTRRSVGLS